QASGVSVMSAARLIRQLASDGFLDDRKHSLRVVRIEELMRRWRAANFGNAREIPARWIIPSGKDQLLSAVRSYSSSMDAKVSRVQRPNAGRVLQSAPRICLGLLAAAEQLGFKFVHG